MLEHDHRPSFAQTFFPHRGAAYNLARWITKNGRDAEDIVQEAYLRVLRFFPGFRGGDPRAWLMTIVHNTSHTWLRRNRPLQMASELDEDHVGAESLTSNGEEVVLQRDSGVLIHKALERLSPNLREIIVLRELEGMSYKEIAEVTGMPPGTVMSTLSRARGRLRQVLTGLTEGAEAIAPRVNVAAVGCTPE